MTELPENYVNIETSMTNTAFWRAVGVLTKKQHVVNKRLWGCKILFKLTCKTQLKDIPSLSPSRVLENINDVEDFKTLLLQDLNIEECANEHNNDVNLEVVLEELLPKAFSENHAFQLIILRKQDNKVMFFDVTPKAKKQTLCPNFSYILQLNNNTVSLITKCIESKSYLWLKDTVLPQFIKWGTENSCTEQKLHTDSLALVCNEKYYQTYNHLKLKYGKEMVKIWPECTDPAKFVYEDIAIATYLLLLWEDERKHLKMTDKLQSFVDLGCGNGLLVYILAQEGHSGVGIDVRKRQIWNMYPHGIKLEEKTITPSDSHLFPETNWIIGNHSDELTPWIPVIAARSSYNCNFFLLPCCAFNFDGSKYQRQDSSKSLYTEYLQYIHKLCEECGFRTDLDRLKIPSTKRICLVGRGRTYCKEEHNVYCNSIQNIINIKTCPLTEESKDQITTWMKDFKPREAIEKVRNCTQLDKTLIDNIVKIISTYLLEGCCLDSNWSIGKTVDLNEVVQLISHNDLKALKSECGGIQTLLKNNHQIFKVQKGKVQLRYPKSVEDVKKDIKTRKNKSVSTLQLQQKPCWFYNNHPQGCPLKSTHCSFLHTR